MLDTLVVLTSFANEADAERVMRALLEERLVACANLLPGVRSLYHWEGRIADEREVMVLMKVRKQDWVVLMSRLHDLHPYETPECLALRVTAGAPRYMAWLESVLGPQPESA